MQWVNDNTISTSAKPNIARHSLSVKKCLFFVLVVIGSHHYWSAAWLFSCHTLLVDETKADN